MNRRSLLCWWVGLAVATGGAAQPVGTSGRILRELRPGTPVDEVEYESVIDAELPALPLPVAGGPTVHVRAFEVSGHTLVSAADLQAELAGHRGREVNFAELQAAAARLTALYRQRGHLLARAYVPPQEIADGVVQLRVVEGWVERVTVESPAATRLRPEIALSAVAPFTTRGPALTQALLERQLLRLNDLPGIRTLAVLDPGSQPGAVEMKLALEEEPRFGGAWGFDNHGSRFTGEWRYQLAAHASDPFGRGDRTDVHILGALEGGMGSYSAHYQRGFPRPGLTAHARVQHVRYDLAEEFDALGADGTASTGELRLDWAVVRAARRRLTLGVGVEQRRLRDFLREVDVENDRELSAVSFEAFGLVRGRSGRGVTGFRAVARGGRLQLHTPEQLALDQSVVGLRTAGDFWRVEAAVWHTQRLGERWSLQLFATGQTTHKNLDSSEKIALGGPHGVRAYAASSGAGDEAVIGRAELRYALAGLPGRTAAQLSAFYDGGAAWLDRRPLAGTRDNRQVLHGGGVGVSVALRWGLQVEASLAWRATPAAREDRDAGGSRVFLSIHQSL